MHRRALPAGRPGAAQGRGRASRRLVVRLARRDIARHRARAVLVMVLVALPVAMICGLAVIWNLTGSTVDDYVEQQFGDADVIVAPLSDWDGHCRQISLGDGSCADGSKKLSAADAARQKATLATVRIPGDTLHPVRTKGVTAHWKGLDVDAQVTGADQLRLRTQQISLPKGATAMPGAHEIWINAEAAHRYGWDVGATVQVSGATYRVTGLVRAASWPAVQIWVGPDHPLAAGGDLTWYGTGPTPSSVRVKGLNDEGLGVMDRAGYRTVQMAGTATEETTRIAVAFAIGALAALVTATIAGAAFAIGARQQRRGLALLGATGADRRVLVRLVRSQGVLLGLGGALAGAALGTALGEGFVAWRNARTLNFPQPLAIPWAPLAGAVVLGVAAATVAAWVPAHAVARQDVLAGVRSAETASRPARFPWVGLGLIVVGIAVGTWAVVGYHRSHPSPDDVSGTEQLMIPLVIGIVALFVGVVASLSWMLSRIARPGFRGPLALRFALRDLARNRGRGVACVAASMAVMTLFSAVLVLMATQDRTDVAAYRPSLPTGVGVLKGSDDSMHPIDDRAADQQLAAVRAEVGVSGEPVRESAVMRCAASGNSDQHIGDTGRRYCEEAMTIMVRTSAVAGAGATDPDAEGSFSFDSQHLMVDDGSLYRVLTGRAPDQRVEAALSRGVVVFDRYFAPRGTTAVVAERSTSAEDLAITRTVVPATVVPGTPGSGVPALIGRDAAARLMGVAPGRLNLAGGRTWMRLQDTPTQAQSDRINASIARATSLQQGFSYETGPSRTALAYLRWGAGLAAVLALTVAVVVLALSLSDSRASRSALASVGASSGSLRGIAAVQALVTVGLGSVLGALVGAAPMALAIWGAGPSMTLAIPWGYLVALALGVPALTGLAVRALVPAARPMLRRRD